MGTPIDEAGGLWDDSLWGAPSKKKPRKERSRDLAFEALVEATRANPNAERGPLNQALGAIKKAAFSEGLTENEAVAEEIRLRASAYRSRFPHLMLTPGALARHWFRVIEPLADQRTETQRAFDQLRGNA